eukprot:comp33795_c0_seq1/m.65064 comp33795_c0_seq1/g.65064  ORF comp33795_c0_seq1/g.65064 comp33795_c0_seq1/m.65064 type:complete len:115 (+) comp33795_c0_seq1:3-347(+)
MEVLARAVSSGQIDGAAIVGRHGQPIEAYGSLVAYPVESLSVLSGFFFHQQTLPLSLFPGLPLCAHDPAVVFSRNPRSICAVPVHISGIVVVIDARLPPRNSAALALSIAQQMS